MDRWFWSESKHWSSVWRSTLASHSPWVEKWAELFFKRKVSCRTLPSDEQSSDNFKSFSLIFFFSKQEDAFSSNKFSSVYFKEHFPSVYFKELFPLTPATVAVPISVFTRSSSLPYTTWGLWSDIIIQNYLQKGILLRPLRFWVLPDLLNPAQTG